MSITKLTPFAILATLGLAACPAEDGDDDTTNASLTTTVTTTTPGTGEDSSGEDSGTMSTTTPAETGSESESGGETAADSSSGGGEECLPTDECREDADCTGGGTCISCICVGGGATMSDYGPCDACATGESPVMIPPAEGCVCAPACGEGVECPAPNEGTGQPMCLLGQQGMDPTNCALICELGGDDCPTGAMCADIGQAPAGVCMHPAP